MIKIKSQTEIDIMKKSGIIAITALKEAGKAIKPGVTTGQLNEIIQKSIENAGAKPSFLGYGGFPASACISVNDEVIHGIPSKSKILKNGDIVSLDVGAYIGGYHGDCARTFAVGEISDEAKRLIEVTRQSFYEGIKFARMGYKISDISAAVQHHIEQNGFYVVKTFVGHGIGKNLHESPEVPNYGEKGNGCELIPGMTLAIEPMVNIGTEYVDIMSDGWTVLTKNRKLSAHYENTIAITNDNPIILTSPEA